MVAKTEPNPKAAPKRFWTPRKGKGAAPAPAAPSEKE